MTSPGHGSVNLPLINLDGDNRGNLFIENVKINHRPNFTEYLRSGWAINTSFAIDFTGSNGDITERDSLHY